jgi:hypothetical protein
MTELYGCQGMRRGAFRSADMISSKPVRPAAESVRLLTITPTGLLGANQQHGFRMRMLYAATLADLSPDDRIRCECAACFRTSCIAGTGLGLPDTTKVLHLKYRLRCQGCGVPGRAVVSIQWNDDTTDLVHREK